MVLLLMSLLLAPEVGLVLVVAALVLQLPPAPTHWVLLESKALMELVFQVLVLKLELQVLTPLPEEESQPLLQRPLLPEEFLVLLLLPSLL